MAYTLFVTHWLCISHITITHHVPIGLVNHKTVTRNGYVAIGILFVSVCSHWLLVGWVGGMSVCVVVGCETVHTEERLQTEGALRLIAALSSAA